MSVPQVRNTDEPFRSQLLEAVAKRTDALDELVRRMYVRGTLVPLKLPPAHHKATGTTNMLERLCGEGRRRTKVIGRFPNEGSCLRLFFATLMAASQSWRGIRMTPAILAELRELRNQLYRNKACSEGEAPSVEQPSRKAS